MVKTTIDSSTPISTTQIMQTKSTNVDKRHHVRRDDVVVPWCIMQCMNIQSGATLLTYGKILSYCPTWPKQHLYKVRSAVCSCLGNSINSLINIFFTCSERQVYNAQKLMLELIIVNVTHECSNLCPKQNIRGLVQLQSERAR